jgi:hypothetical protein
MKSRQLWLVAVLVIGWIGMNTGYAADVVADVMASGKWQPMWDGKTFTGWHLIGSGKWTIEDGAIVARHRANDGEFGHLVTDAIYRDFIVRIKYKSITGNSGLYFRVDEKGFSGVTGFQAEIDWRNDAGGLYETNGRAWVVQPKPEDVKKWFKQDDWNEMVVAALGRNVVVYVNGMKSAEIRNDPGRLAGKFALQAHAGQDVEIMFKDLQIMTFDSLTAAGDLSAFRKPTGEWASVDAIVPNPNNDRALAAGGKPDAPTVYNGPKGTTSNVFTEFEHGDLAAHIEFMIPKGSNSGIYFQSRYEIQVYDSFGVEKDKYPGIECGGIYPRWINNSEHEGHSPRINASLPPGQWQSFDVVFQAPKFDASGKKIANAKFVKVVHNGQLIHENIEVTGPTRAAAFEDEKTLGPILFQGDHGPIAYRNVSVMRLGK